VISRLKDVFAKALPMLQSIKHDNLRWVFAFGSSSPALSPAQLRRADVCIAALGRFFEAIHEHAASAGPSAADVFADDVYVAFDVLSQWLQRGEAKVLRDLLIRAGPASA
jgi:hypothetical protein